MKKLGRIFLRFNEINCAFLNNNVRLYSKQSNEQVIKEKEVFSLRADEDVETRLEEEEELIEKKRNKSSLWPQHYNIIHNKLPYNEPQHYIHESLRYQRKMFGRYGNASGVNPGFLWPSENDIKERYEYESIAYPYTIQEMWERAKHRQEKEEQVIIEHQTKLANNLKKLDKWKKDIADRAAKKLALAEAAKSKKEALVEEVRRHFGFQIDPKDERFQEMLLKKEKDQKKRLKAERSKMKHEKMLGILMKKETSS